MALGIEGALRLRLTVRGEEVVKAELDSSRPVGVAVVFEGRRPKEVVRLIPNLFGVCSTAQTVAALGALESAHGMAIPAGHGAARTVAVAVETAREHLGRILLDWPRWLGREPWSEHARRSYRFPGQATRLLYPDGDFAALGGGRLAPDRQGIRSIREELETLVRKCLGSDPDRFMDLQDLGKLQTHLRSRADAAPAPAFLRYLQEQGWTNLGASEVAGLPTMGPGDLAERLAGDDSGQFVAWPQWNGGVRETSPLTRQAEHPLVADAVAHHGTGVLARHLARMVELASLPASLEAPGDDEGGAPAGAGPGTGLGTVEAARGRLVHYAEVGEGAIQRFRILAPTEWNFHPEGLVVAGLSGARLPGNLPPDQGARLVVDAVDPCVACEVEVIRE